MSKLIDRLRLELELQNKKKLTRKGKNDKLKKKKSYKDPIARAEDNIGKFYKGPPEPIVAKLIELGALEFFNSHFGRFYDKYLKGVRNISVEEFAILFEEYIDKSGLRDIFNKSLVESRAKREAYEEGRRTIEQELQAAHAVREEELQAALERASKMTLAKLIKDETARLKKEAREVGAMRKEAIKAGARIRFIEDEYSSGEIFKGFKGEIDTKKKEIDKMLDELSSFKAEYKERDRSDAKEAELFREKVRRILKKVDKAKKEMDDLEEQIKNQPIKSFKEDIKILQQLKNDALLKMNGLETEDTVLNSIEHNLDVEYGEIMNKIEDKSQLIGFKQIIDDDEEKQLAPPENKENPRDQSKIERANAVMKDRDRIKGLLLENGNLINELEEEILGYDQQLNRIERFAEQEVAWVDNDIKDKLRQIEATEKRKLEEIGFYYESIVPDQTHYGEEKEGYPINSDEEEKRKDDIFMGISQPDNGAVLISKKTDPYEEKLANERREEEKKNAQGPFTFEVMSKMAAGNRAETERIAQEAKNTEEMANKYKKSREAKANEEDVGSIGKSTTDFLDNAKARLEALKGKAADEKEEDHTELKELADQDKKNLSAIAKYIYDGANVINLKETFKEKWPSDRNKPDDYLTKTGQLFVSGTSRPQLVTLLRTYAFLNDDTFDPTNIPLMLVQAIIEQIDDKLDLDNIEAMKSVKVKSPLNLSSRSVLEIKSNDGDAPIVSSVVSGMPEPPATIVSAPSIPSVVNTPAVINAPSGPVEEGEPEFGSGVDYFSEAYPWHCLSRSSSCAKTKEKARGMIAKIEKKMRADPDHEHVMDQRRMILGSGIHDRKYLTYLGSFVAGNNNKKLLRKLNIR